ncbi:MAG: hypothetical protein U0T83_02855 [Bacteriovoracaceae bacterium]
MTDQIFKIFYLNNFELPTVVILNHISNAIFGENINGFERFIQVVTEHNYMIKLQSKYPIPQIKNT